MNLNKSVRITHYTRLGKFVIRLNIFEVFLIKILNLNVLIMFRCKVFAKIGGSFKDKGVGQLFVVKKPESEKYQVVVRAENTLGTILLNILLQKGIPLSSKGKDVMTCDPAGDDGKPVMILIRVKNPESATELLSKLQGFLAES